MKHYLIFVALFVFVLFLFAYGHHQTISLKLGLLPLNLEYLMKKSFVFHQYKVSQPNSLILIPLYIYLASHKYVIFRLFCELLDALSFLLKFQLHHCFHQAYLFQDFRLYYCYFHLNYLLTGLFRLFRSLYHLQVVFLQKVYYFLAQKFCSLYLYPNLPEHHQL